MSAGALTVAELMTRKPVRLRPDERLDIALALMVSCRFRHLPVENAGALVGLVSLRDLYAADLSHVASSRGERAMHLRSIEARQVMSAPVVTATPEESYWSAGRSMLNGTISCLPVVDGRRLIGILTRTDYLRPLIDLLRSEAAETGHPTRVAALMTRQPLSLAVADHLDVARTLMAANRVRHLPVLDGDRVVGIVSDHDLLRTEASSLEARPANEVLTERSLVLVRDVMTSRVSAIDSEDAAVDAVQILLRRRFGALPVVSAHKLVGILTVTDLFYHLLTYAPAEAALAATR